MCVSHYNYLEHCVLDSECTKPDVFLLDHRFYYFDADTSRVHATAKFLRHAAQRAINRRNPSRLTTRNYTTMMENMEGNSSMIGFAAEGATISSIRSQGLPAASTIFDLKGPATQLSFDGEIPKYVFNKAGFRIYVPERFNFPAIDLILVKNKAAGRSKQKTAGLYPIQVTLNYSSHSDSEKSFFKKWEEWVKNFAVENISITETVFVWVTPDGGVSEAIKEDQLGFPHPEYTRRLISFEEVDSDIHKALVRIDGYPKPKQRKATASRDSSPALESPVATPPPAPTELPDSTGNTSTTGGSDPAMGNAPVPVSPGPTPTGPATSTGKRNLGQTGAGSEPDLKRRKGGSI